MRILLAVSLAVMLAGCAMQQAEGGKMKVVASFYPVYDIAKAVGGDAVEASSIVPAGVEPHEYEPTPRQVEDLSQADAYVILGTDFAEFEHDLGNAVEGRVKVINAGEGVPLINVSEDGHGETEDGGVEDDHGPTDPHIWLSPKNMIIMAKNVRDGLIEADPSNAQAYRANADEYAGKLQVLDSEYRAGLADCRKNAILVNHDAFGYLAHEYGFEQIAIAGLNPESEPTPQELAELIDEAREHDIGYVFYEELVDPRVAETIAGEVNATVLELNPIEGTKNPNEDYFSIMRRNLANLRLALECS
ncbi:MAG: zinc ABC transporter substrate-binding protein [Candidatus Micrarchaeota archaeon]